jgi:YegS/Rv2252/BmrU family lipid kinase
MLHCFIINPAAGSGKEQEALLPHIIEAAKQGAAGYEIHRTTGAGEATLYVRDRLARDSGITKRFYAVGGDGTTKEVLNGLYGHPDAELAIVPAGSGNDFVRNFGEAKPFLDMARQMAGQAIPIDVMRCDSAREDLSGYALNMFNFGFDAKVVAHMARMRNVVRGKGAYVAGVMRELASYKMSLADIRIDGAPAFRATILLAGVGNGRFSGGGFDGMPMARVDDGFLDVMVIDPLTRLEFIRLVGAYHDGNHIEHPLLAGKYRHQRCIAVQIAPVTDLIFAADGEATETDVPIRISLAKERIRFVLPEGVSAPRIQPSI